MSALIVAGNEEIVDQKCEFLKLGDVELVARIYPEPARTCLVVIDNPHFRSSWSPGSFDGCSSREFRYRMGCADRAKRTVEFDA